MNVNTKGRNQSTKPPPKKRQRPQSQTFARQIGAVASTTAPEKKNVDGSATITSAAATTWSAVTLVNGIAQGTTANTRIGRRVTISKLFVRWHVTSTASVARWMVVYDHAPNGSLPAITDILTVDSFIGVNNLINNDRFLILHDEIVNQQAASVPVGGKWIYKGQALQQQYTNAATATIADITTGAIYIMVVGSAASTALGFTFRTRYTDM